MFNFKRLYEFLFKSFLVGRDVEMVERFQKEWHGSILLIKRSWLYGLASLFWMVPLGGIGALNVYLIIEHFNETNPTFGIVLAVFVGLNIVGTLYSSFRYVWDFRKNYGSNAKIVHTEDLIVRLKSGDNTFSRCFNQLQTNFLIFLLVIAVYVVHIFFFSNWDLKFAILDVICILVQLFLIRRFIHLIIDLEMDFNIVVKWRVMFVNQEWMYSNINTIESDKIKSIRSTYPNFLASFFHYGTLEVLTEGDVNLMGHNIIEFVDRPELTVENINSMLSGKIVLEERVHNKYLQDILAKFPNLSGEDRKSAIKKYLSEYELQIKKEYQSSQDQELRQDIEEIYLEYYK